MASFNFPPGVSRNDPDFNRILRIIAGFRGYETLEDLKAADEQVREQLAGQLDKAVAEAAGARRAIESGTHVRILSDFDEMVGRIRSGRGGIRDRFRERVAACEVYRPRREAIHDTYRLDFRMLAAAENVYNLMQEFVRLSREDMMLSNIYKIDVSLREIADCMEKKRQLVGCMIE